MKTLADTAGRATPITSQEFLGYYGGAKLRCYSEAVDSLELTQLERGDCMVKVFTKAEYRKPKGAPRAIQPRSPRYNVCLGRYLKPIEHPIYFAIDKIFDPSGTHRTVAKGMNNAERGNVIRDMWASFPDPVAIGLDASRFDQHINKLLLEHEQKVYHMWSSGKGREGLPDLCELLKSQMFNRGKYKGKDGVIRYCVEACRMSGDMNTSLGNVIDMCTCMFSWIEKCELLGQVMLLNDGDDCVIIMDRRNMRKFQQGLDDWFARLGLTMEVDGIYETLESIEFCQSRPVQLDEIGNYCMVPRATKRLYSDMITTKDVYARKVYNKQVGAVAGCGLASSSGLPIFQSFYSYIGRGAKAWIPVEGDMYFKFRQELIQGMIPKCREVCDATRVSFYLAFGITPSEQVELEQYYTNLRPPTYCKPKLDTDRTLDPIQYLAEPEQVNRETH